MNQDFYFRKQVIAPDLKVISRDKASPQFCYKFPNLHREKQPLTFTQNLPRNTHYEARKTQLPSRKIVVQPLIRLSASFSCSGIIPTVRLMCLDPAEPPH